MIERLLLCACWAVKRQSRYLLYLPSRAIVLPSMAEAMCVQLGGLPPRLQAKLVELSSYQCSFEAGQGAWNVMAALKEVAAAAPEPPETQVEQKMWEHPHDIPIKRPKKKPDWTPASKQRGWRLFFDGGCKDGLGCGGFVLFDMDGECVGGIGRWYGKQAPTQNIAEAQAMVDGLAYVGARNMGRTKILVLGDSELVINFMLRKYKPAMQELVLRVQKTQEL